MNIKCEGCRNSGMMCYHCKWYFGIQDNFMPREKPKEVAPKLPEELTHAPGIECSGEMEICKTVNELIRYVKHLGKTTEM